MKKNLFLNQLIILMSVCMLSSCEAIGGIFKAGVWAGVLLVVVVIGLIIFIISKVAGKK